MILKKKLKKRFFRVARGEVGLNPCKKKHLEKYQCRFKLISKYLFFFMAQYKIHSTFNIFLALPLALWGLIHFFHPSLNLIIIFSTCFIYATLFMNPDQDITNKIKLFSLRGLFTLPFRGYSLIFKHRGISHSFVLGTATRVLWLSGFFYMILYVLDKPFLKKNELIAILKSDHFIYGFSAIVLADFCHLLLDFKHKK